MAERLPLPATRHPYSLAAEIPVTAENCTPKEPPAAPGAPALIAGNRELTVSWQAVPGAFGYEVWYGLTNSQANAARYGADVPGTTLTLGNLVNGNTYYVWIKAKNNAGTSGFGPPAQARPAADPSAPALAAAGLYQGAAFASAAKIGSYTLEQALTYISANAVSGDRYYIVLGADASIPPQTLGYSNKTVGITLMTDGAERTVQLASNGSLFTVNSSVTLTLENNVTLKGRVNNTASLVGIASSGIFTMKGGKISGNTASSSYGGGGVCVYSGSGTFTKSSTGGVITGYSSDTANGNKVVINGVVQSGYGHAVYVSSNPVKKLEKTVPANKALDSRSSSGWTE